MNKKQHISILLATALISLFMLWGIISRIQFDFDLRNFYPLEHEETEYFEEYVEHFGWDNNYILLGVECKGAHIYQPAFLKEVDSLSNSLLQLEEIVQLIGPTKQEIYRYVPFMDLMNSSPLLALDSSAARLAQDSLKVVERPDLLGQLFAEDQQSVLILMQQKEGMQYEDCKRLIGRIDSLIQPFEEFKALHFAGKCYGQTTFVDLSRQEVATFVGLSILVIIIALFFSYRRFWGVWMPLSVVGVTVLWTLGTMMWLGFSLDFISNMIPTIILIIGISNVIHLFSKFLLGLQAGQAKKLALKQAIKEVGRATILTSGTTIIGFLSLLFSNVSPLINLGAFAALGLIYAFLLTYSFFPALLMISRASFQLKAAKDDFWQQQLGRLALWVEGHYGKIIIGSLLLMALGLWGSSQLRINQHVLDDLSERHPQIVDSRFFENEFKGSRQFEMEIILRDSSKSLSDTAVLRALDPLERYLLEEYGLGSMFSPLARLKMANRMTHSGKADYYRLPQSRSEWKKAQKIEANFLANGRYPLVVLPQGKRGRFAGKMPDMGSLEAQKRHAALAQFIRDQELDQLIDYRLTGSAYLMDINNHCIADNVFYGLLLCFLFIFLLMLYLFRSWRMASIALLPNILPLALVGALMAWNGVDIKISTSILFIIAFGIAVDDSIHFMAAYRLASQEAKSKAEALRTCFRGTGKAIVVTTLILVSGFSCLLFSSFMGTFYIGLYTSICLFLALLADLLLLPALILRFGEELQE
ncbi:putative RND superfamily exporter [Saprospira grandis DSM 2844]|uniref:Putative RND superfamily exporter n=1 Tax=Saprospira grandis DSM 2844 TaxID=694433 RepID=J0NWP8_9BACT|nr:efflux RND transporter permease subunit [Saprospira grandis]EJF51929.1 putative RND superfamily exporter [Saprospira grandis DSM 2844]